MIRIEYNSVKQELRISGHANYAPEGQDIVCAGISALYGALAIHPHTRIEEAPGERLVTTQMGKEPIMEPLCEMIVNAIECIAEEYPDYVNLTRVM